MDDRTLSVHCPAGHAFSVPAEAAGREVPCPACGALVRAAIAPGEETPRGTARRIVPETVDPALIPGYSIQKRLGLGGMGAVYLARQESLDRQVAIKLLPPQLAKNQAYVQRFITEARSAGKVGHENIVGAVDVGEAGGRYFFVMEYVAGETLYRLIKQGGALPEARALDLARQIARGLRQAHKQGLIHRDIKPKNIMITPEGVAKICDFGLAREATPEAAEAEAGFLHTSPAYASPEQCLAQPALDHRTDMYSLGITLFEMLTARRPFTAESVKELLAKQISEEPPSARAINPSISAAADRLVLRLLRKKPEERFQTYDELVDAIDAILKPPEEAAPPAAPALRTRRRDLPPIKSSAILWAGGAAAAVVLGVAGLFLLGRGKEDSPPVETPPEESSGIDPAVHRLLEEARALQKAASGHPGDYPAVRAKWKSLEERFRNTRHHAPFASGLIEFDARVTAEADGVAKELLSEADRAARAGQLGQALRVLRKFSPGFEGTPASARVAKQVQDLERAADERYRLGLQLCQTFISGGRWDDARTHLDQLESSLPPSNVYRVGIGDFRKKVKEEEALAGKRAAEAAAAKPKPADPVPPVGILPPKNPVNAAPAAAEVPPHLAVLRDDAARGDPEKRAGAAAAFLALGSKSAFGVAAAAFLSRGDAAWNLSDAAKTGLAEYLASPLLVDLEKITPAQHGELLALLGRKIESAPGAGSEALLLFACGHVEELLAHGGKPDPGVLRQARIERGPLTDLPGVAPALVRIEMSRLLGGPPGLPLVRAAEASVGAADFPSRLLGALCLLKDPSLDPLAASERWKKLGSAAPDPALGKFCEAVAERLRAASACEPCAGQGKYSCSSCTGSGVTACSGCQGAGLVPDGGGGRITCLACKKSGLMACPGCTGSKTLKCPACEGKKSRPAVAGGSFRYLVDLGLCRSCSGSGSLFPRVGYPCPACEGNGRAFAEMPRDLAALPAWVRAREGRVLFLALRWLARHQAPEGFWATDDWAKACSDKSCAPAALGAPHDAGLTALAALAFLGAGTGAEGDLDLGGFEARPVLQKALDWLVSRQDAEGLIAQASEPPSSKALFEHLLATYALATALQAPGLSEAWADKDRARLREAAVKAVRFALAHQQRGAGWKYSTATLETDSWVTGWGGLALLAARDAGLEVPRANLTSILQWLDSVTDRKDLQVGYTPAEMGKITIPGNETFAHHETLSALMGWVRFAVDGRSTTPVAAVPRLLVADLPNPDPVRRDFCHWFAGTLFLAQRDQRRGTAWNAWSQALGRELLLLQEGRDSCALGSWAPSDRWGAFGGRVYATALNALTLTYAANTRLPSKAK